MMNVLHVIAGMNPDLGGVCQAVKTIAGGLEKEGILNEIVTTDDPDDSFLQDIFFITHAIGRSKGPWKYNAELIPWLVRNLNRFNVVIIHGIWLYQGYAVQKALKVLKTRNDGLRHNTPKIFIYPHGMMDPYFQHSHGRKLKTIRNYIYWNIIECRLLNNADAIFFTSQEECRLAKIPFKNYKPKKEFVIGMGINKPPLFEIEMRQDFNRLCPQINGQPYLLFLGRIHEKKGVDLLIRAYDNIFDVATINGVTTDYGDYRAAPVAPRLVVAGPGMETVYGKTLEKMVSSNAALSNVVFFPGMLTGLAKWGAFYGCEAFVLASHQENFGISVAEALACHKVTIISNQVNIWKEIDSMNGGIVEDDTLEGTMIALQSWKNLSFEKRKHMQDQAYNTFEEYFSVEKVSRNFVEVLKQFFDVHLESNQLLM